MKEFFKNLFDSRNRTVDQVVFFTFLFGISIIVYGIVQLCLKPDIFKISDFGQAFGWLLGGGAAHAVGSGWQNKLNPGAPDV